ncbi:MAG: MFS transporter [Azospirillaceae bacterium]
MPVTDTLPPIDETRDRLYAVLSGDDREDRACDAIPDGACAEVPRNYLLNVANGAATKLAEQLASPGLVLPWLMAGIGAPAGLVGFLAPIKQVGALLPQLAVAARIRVLARRKVAWVGAGVIQAICLALMIPAALALPPLAAGLAILLLLAVFSTASGVGSVAFQDVLGKTVPKGRRGRLLSNRAAIGGALTLAAGLYLRLTLGEETVLAPYLWLLAAAALLWALAALLFARIEELPGATEGGRNALDQAREGVGLVRRIPGYRSYLIARALLVTVEIAMPIYALHAHGLFGGAVASLGVYVVAVGIANIVSSPFWGRFSDLSARRTMALSGVIGAFAGGLALALAVAPEAWRTAETYALVFFVLGIAEAGVRLGRKTYLVDAAAKDERPLFVAFANSAVGLVTLAAGAIGFVAQGFNPAVAIAVLAVLALAGAAAALAMPEADAMMDGG